MKCKVYHFLSYVLAFIFFVNLQVYSFASTTSGSDYYNWTAGEKFTYFLLNGMNILGDCYSMIIGADDADDVWTDFFDFVSQEYLEENQTFEEWCLSNTSWYYDNSGIQNENTVTGFSMTPTMADALQLTVNNYVANNPLTFTECYISSYNYINTDQFGSYGLYQSVKEVIKNNNGWSFIASPAGNNASTKNMYLITVDKSKFGLNFIGTTTQGSFTNVSLEHNWSGLSTFPENTEGVDIRFFQIPNGTLGAPAKTYQQAAANAGYNSTWVQGFSSIKNTSSVFAGQGYGNVFTNMPKNELVYVFRTLNALKNYNSGSPQPYYLGSDFGTHKTNYSVSNFPNSNNSYYSQVVNNIQSGWSADEVLTLVDKVIKNGGSSSGSSSDSENNQSKWWERIGNAIGNLIDGLVDVLTKVIEKLSDALLSIIHLLTGYTDDGGTYHQGLFDKLTDLVDSGFSSFISSMFSWLPDEIVTLLTATLVFGIFFGIFKMLRR